MEELKKISCTEFERTQRLRMNELSRQEKERQFTVHQHTVQVQELRDKVNSLSDSREFHDLETACSSGLSHVPSHLGERSESSRNALPRFLLAG